jgi:opacity protein-like surface antigen
MKRTLIVALSAAGLMSVGVLAQSSPNVVTVPLSDPNRPGTIKAQLLQGSITVKGTTRKDVVVILDEQRDPRSRPAESNGLRRLGQPAGINITEENNIVTIGTGIAGSRRFGGRGGGDIELEVPSKTNLQLNTHNGDRLVVEGVEGDLEVTSMNGSITLTDVSGAIVAHAMNGRVLVTLKQATPQKPMSFTSFNAAVDVTLPPSLKAILKMRSDHGEVFTDFDVQHQQRGAGTQTTSANGRLRIRVDNSIYGTINGGGPEFELRTFKGNIYLRKGK